MAHRKSVRHFHEAGHLHELTFSCYRRMPLLTNDSWRERLARCVEAAGYYLNVPPRQQHPDLPMIHGLPEGSVV